MMEAPQPEAGVSVAKSGRAARRAKEVGHPRILKIASERYPLEGYRASKSHFEKAGPEKSQHSFLS